MRAYWRGNPQPLCEQMMQIDPDEIGTRLQTAIIRNDLELERRRINVAAQAETDLQPLLDVLDACSKAVSKAAAVTGADHSFTMTEQGVSYGGTFYRHFKATSPRRAESLLLEFRYDQNGFNFVSTNRYLSELFERAAPTVQTDEGAAINLSDMPRAAAAVANFLEEYFTGADDLLPSRVAGQQRAEELR